MRASGRAASPLLFGGLGTLVFLNVYAPQSLLPLLAHEFGVGAAQVGSVVGATMLAMALASPLAGVLADAVGRRRTVLWAFGLLALPAVLAVWAQGLGWLNAVRFAQGLLIPGVMVALNAYIAEEVPPTQRSRALTSYVTGTVLGGFLGRFLAGLAAQWQGWHAVFWMLALASAAGFVLARQLPPEAQFRPHRDPGAVLSSLGRHLRNRALLATCAVGFLILFTLVGVFNTLTLRLAAPPYGLNSAQTGLIFAVYLLGVVVTPVAGPFLAARGPTVALLSAVALNLLGLALTLSTPLPLIVLGVAGAACGVFLSQSAALAAVQRSISEARSLASGLYHLAYYGGAAVSSLVAGHVYKWGGWRAVAALVASSMALAGLVGALGWSAAARKP